MSSDNEILADEAVLLAFSVEPEHSPATLQRYLAKYPHLTGDLLDLSHDIELSGLEDAPGDGDFNTPELDHSWVTFNLKLTEGTGKLSDEEMQAIHSSFTTPAMRGIGLPLSALQSIRGGSVLAQGFPTRWLAKIAAVADVAVESVRLYLDRPSQLSPSVSYKSVEKPAAQEKVSFSELIESTNLTKDEKAEILREE
jgi:hypothetical protein